MKHGIMWKLSNNHIFSQYLVIVELREEIVVIARNFITQSRPEDLFSSL